MSTIVVEHHPAPARLESLAVTKWPTWSKEVSVFEWHFLEEEIAYILEGECTVTPHGGAAVEFGKGDLVTFPAGMKCRWEVRQPLRKHYHLEGSKLAQIARRVRALLFRA